jgi:uncharacterized Zn finger protein
MTDSSMPTTTLLITCPVCAASGSMIHHDIRSSLVYSCLNCTHEWEIDPAIEAATTKPAVIESIRERVRAPSGARRHKV